MPVTVSVAQFTSDPQGRTFSDLARDPQLRFADWLAFFADDDRQRRMCESEIHHDRQALAGVVRELEHTPIFAAALTKGNPLRYRQAVGVIVRIYMERLGWQRTGRKGALGTSIWFRSSERYVRTQGMPYTGPPTTAPRDDPSPSCG